jgi:hypothetical protein
MASAIPFFFCLWDAPGWQFKYPFGKLLADCWGTNFAAAQSAKVAYSP